MQRKEAVMDSRDKSQVWTNVVRWAARVWSIPAIIFVVGHIVAPDANGGGEVFWYEWLAVGTMFASVLALVLAWWKEKIGGWASLALLVVSMIVYAVYKQELFPLPGLLILFVGIVVPAILFLVSDRFHTQQPI
jgi:hypothetical protein